jgi:hypothetical protein
MHIRLIKQITASLRPRHYFALLGCVLGLTFLSPLIEHSVWAKIAIAGMLIASLLTATLAVKNNGQYPLTALSLAVLSGAMWILALCDHTTPFNTVNFQILAYAITLAFFIITCGVILQDVLSGSVNSNKIAGAVCVYVLIGFCFAMVHMMVALSDSSAYRSPLNTSSDLNHLSPSFYLERYPLFSYYSFCTLSTVGYGDILPISRLARVLSCMEATFGQLYLAVLVARLVGLHTASVSMRHRNELRSAHAENELVSSRKI